MQCKRLELVLSCLLLPYFDCVLQVWCRRMERDEANSIFCKLLSREWWWIAWQVKQWASSVGDLDQVQGEFKLRFWDSALSAQKCELKINNSVQSLRRAAKKKLIANSVHVDCLCACYINFYLCCMHVSIRKRLIFHIVLILCHTFEQINRFTVAAVCR